MNPKDSLGRVAVFLLAMIALFQLIGLLKTEARSAPQSGAEAGELAEELAELLALGERRAETLERIEAELSLLRSRRARPASTGEAGVAQVGAEAGEQLAPESLDELVRSLDELRASFERETEDTREVLRESTEGELSMLAMRERKQEPDWFALELLESSWRVNPDSANRSQHFLTAKDLLRIYGPPTAIYRPSGGLNFTYRRHGDGSAALSFVLQDGFVVRFFVKD